MKNPIKITIASVLALLLFLTICFSITTVDTGCAGVVKAYGAPTGRVLENGIHLKVPWVQRVEEVDTQVQKVQEQASAVSKDLQAVSIEIAVNYRILPGKAIDVVRRVGSKYLESEIVVPTLQESVKAVSAKYTAEELISQRSKVSIEMSKALQHKLDGYEIGILVEGFNVVNFKFSKAFNKAIEAKQVAAQELIRVKTEQEQLVVKAEAKAAAAKANAEATLTAAQAQAEANRLLNESITPTLLEWTKLNKWDGALPLAQGGNPIIDFRK